MSDIFREVDEDIRRDQLEQLWKRYGGVIIAAAVVIVVATGGYRAWTWYQNKQAADAGERYHAAVTLAGEGKQDEAIAAFAEIAGGSSGYASLARMRAAAAMAADGDKAGAGEAYEAIAGDGSVDPLIRDAASVRAAYLAIGDTPLAAMQARLAGQLADDNQFRHSARAVMALTAYREGHVAETARWAETALADAAVPQNLRQRLELILQVIAAQRAPKA